MGRIHDSRLRALAEEWSPVVKAALADLGNQTWTPYQEKQGFLRKPKLIPRFIVEGPAERGDELIWALSHTSKPSAFDARGDLSHGEREYWLVILKSGQPPTFRIEGAQPSGSIPVDRAMLISALGEAQAAGPIREHFYGNKGPLSQKHLA